MWPEVTKTLERKNAEVALGRLYKVLFVGFTPVRRFRLNSEFLQVTIFGVSVAGLPNQSTKIILGASLLCEETTRPLGSRGSLNALSNGCT